MDSEKKISVLIVDDSRIFRGIIEESLKGEADIEVIGSVRNGIKALEFIAERKPDVITLDVEMPEMDGLETLKKIQQRNRRITEVPIGVIMLSALTKEGAQATIEALEQGAFDFIAKPSTSDKEENLRFLKQQLCSRIRAYRHSTCKKEAPRPLRTPLKSTAMPDLLPSVFKVILIGVSTGGPQALSQLLPQLCEITNLPIVIVQHMPETFTESLARNLNKKCRHQVQEAFTGTPIKGGNIYIAPGGCHLILKKEGHDVVAVNNRQPPENGCRPSVDVMFRSAAPIYGKNILALILTGMGNDGTKGLKVLKRNGAAALAQDEASSVVWGMPGSAVEAGVVDQIKPLAELPKTIQQLLN